MRTGGGKNKGSAFERDTGKVLSKWLTYGERTNIFARNVLSGGSFTVTARKGKETPNIPGDLMAASPLAFAFLEQYSVECKHHADISLDVFLRDRKGTSFLAKVIASTAKQASEHGVAWLVIAKENRQEPIVLMTYHIGHLLLPCAAEQFRYHALFNNQYLMTTLDNLTENIDPVEFISAAKQHRRTKDVNSSRRRYPS